ncbi:BnaCnng65260D [Brassica napus]|uniref:BnaCnng65260D protein n=1 Tax=Brassica napus TaxID=3708 RepID=A0A078JQE0_BRANA|nr:BnaCnng65260D [Brassica napus]
MGRTREGRAWRRIKLCPQMLVPRKIKLQNRALFYWTKINPLFRIYRRRMLDIRKRGKLLWHFAVQRVIEQGNLLPHSNLLIRQTARPEKLYPGYNPFAPIDKKKLKELADWLKTCPHYRTDLDKKPRKNRTLWYQILQTSLEWLEDSHIDAWINVLKKRYDANSQHFRSERMCFLDHHFAQQWRFNFKDFKDSEPDQNGTIPSFCQSNKRHIFVFDSICSSFSLEELDVFNKKDFAKANGKSMRDKIAVDIFQELPDAHEFKNKDMDDNLGAYDGRLTVKSSGMLDDLTISSLESFLSSDLLARPSQICLVVQVDKEVDTYKFITQIFKT